MRVIRYQGVRPYIWDCDVSKVIGGRGRTIGEVMSLGARPACVRNCIPDLGFDSWSGEGFDLLRPYPSTEHPDVWILASSLRCEPLILREPRRQRPSFTG